MEDLLEGADLSLLIDLVIESSLDAGIHGVGGASQQGDVDGDGVRWRGVGCIIHRTTEAGPTRNGVVA